jgi:hypothetical protein
MVVGVVAMLLVCKNKQPHVLDVDTRTAGVGDESAETPLVFYGMA